MKYIGLLSSAASGKLGGIVASHNRGGSYFRHHTVPTQPRTAAQRAVRNQLASLSSAFRNIGATNISGWNALGATVTLKSKLGTTYHPTGQQLFVSCNKHLLEAGINTELDIAPTIPTIPGIGTFAITQPTPGTAVTTIPWTVAGGLDASMAVIVRATSVQSAGRTFAGKSLYRTLGYANPASGLTADFFTLYTGKFGPLPQAGIASFSLKYVDPASGFAGPLVTASMAFSQPSGTNLFSFTMTANPVTLSITTGTVTDVVILTDNAPFNGAISWSVINSSTPNISFSFDRNPKATAPTLTLTKETGLTAGSYTATVQGQYGTFTYQVSLAITVTA